MASNYDRMMQQMTIEELAEKNVQLVVVDDRQLFYLTSSGQLFNRNDYNNAVRHEYEWLSYDPDQQGDCDQEQGEPDTNEQSM